MQKNNTYKMNVCEIKGLNPDTKSLVLEFDDTKEAKSFDFLPGQFLFLSVPGYGEGILTFTNTADDLPKVEVAVRSVGVVTKALHRLEVGDTVFLRGPYGKAYETRKMGGRQVLVIAGGIGLAPLCSLIRYVENDPKNVGELKIFIGAKNPEDLIYKTEYKKWSKFAELNLAVNKADGDWKGHVGLITDLFDETDISADAIAILCGPPAMYRPTIEKLKKHRLKDENIYVMLERRMKCGIGKCQHCTCGEKYVCIDGPTFSWDEIKDNWEALT